jgi:predicted RNase H-like HicB family nuclease
MPGAARDQAAEISSPLVDKYNAVHISTGDEGYIADIPDLRFCSAFGTTPATALAALEKAKAAWLDAARSSGKPIPRPRYRPAIYQVAPR